MIKFILTTGSADPEPSLGYAATDSDCCTSRHAHFFSTHLFYSLHIPRQQAIKFLSSLSFSACFPHALYFILFIIFLFSLLFFFFFFSLSPHPQQGMTDGCFSLSLVLLQVSSCKKRVFFLPTIAKCLLIGFLIVGLLCRKHFGLYLTV